MSACLSRTFAPRRNPALALLAVSAGLAATAGCATHMAPPQATRRPPPRVGLPRPTTPGVLSIDTPLQTICAQPAGAAVLNRDLPGLTTRPEFAMFKTMSLRTLAGLSGGKLTPDKLTQVQADLAQASTPLK